jgi:hypothetical protein
MTTALCFEVSLMSQISSPHETLAKNSSFTLDLFEPIEVSLSGHLLIHDFFHTRSGWPDEKPRQHTIDLLMRTLQQCLDRIVAIVSDPAGYAHEVGLPDGGGPKADALYVARYPGRDRLDAEVFGKLFHGEKYTAAASAGQPCQNMLSFYDYKHVRGGARQCMAYSDAQLLPVLGNAVVWPLTPRPGAAHFFASEKFSWH